MKSKIQLLLQVFFRLFVLALIFHFHGFYQIFGMGNLSILRPFAAEVALPTRPFRRKIAPNRLLEETFTRSLLERQ